MSNLPPIQPKIIQDDRPIAIEGFCGPGGMALGLSEAGFDLALSFDIDRPSIETISQNQPHKAVVLDATVATGAMLRDLAEIGDADLDLFSGGPPCQGFSKQRRGAHHGDPRNDLILHFVRLVEELRPKFFILENVAIFGQKRGKEYLKHLQARLSGSYFSFPEFYCSADYGLAQLRDRFILVGQRTDIPELFCRPAPTTPRHCTVGDILSDIPEPPSDYSVHPQLPNHQRARVTEVNIKRFSFVPEGGGWQDIPEEYRLPCHKNADTSRGGWPDVYGRLEWNGQCATITGGFDSFTRGRYGHPRFDRPLTPHEAARLQGFPKTYRFCGNRGDVRSQIGNAVPPPLACAIGTQIIKVLTGESPALIPRAGMQFEIF